jgi:hypothetical protein
VEAIGFGLYSPCIVSSESLFSSYKRIASFSSNCVDMVHGSPEINLKGRNEYVI